MWYTIDKSPVYRQRKWKNNNEGFDKLHIILLIHVYALAQIGQVK